MRVNNREYCTDVPYKTDKLARDGAAQKAFMICRAFSANDGMIPGQRPGQGSASGVVQGLPVAIGAGRRGGPIANGKGSGSGGGGSGSASSGGRGGGGSSNRHSNSSYDTQSSSDGGTSSGGTSPKSFDSGFEQQLRQVTPQMPRPGRPLPMQAARRPVVGADNYLCLCRRGSVRKYGRCGYCLLESGWA